jgi:hypothetical protein
MALARLLLSSLLAAGVAVVLLAACALVGFAVVPARLRPTRSAVAMLASLSFGATAIGWLAWLLGTLVGTAAIAPVLVLLCLWALRTARAFWAISRRAAHHLALLLRASPVTGLVLAAVLLLLVPQLLLPVVDSDGLRYHLALPKLFLLTGRVSLYPYDVTGAFPQTAEMLYLVGLQAGCPQAAKFLHAGFFLAALAALALLVHRDRRTRVAALLAALLFAVSPVALAQAPAAFTDHVALFHVAVALVLLSRRADPLLVGLALGGALTTKLTMAPVAAVLWAAAIVRAAPGARTRAGLRAALPVLLAIAPFAARNVAAVGDPFHPIGRGLLGLPIPGVSADRARFASFYHPDIAAPLGIAWGPGLASAPPDEVAGWHHLPGLFAVAVAASYAPARLALLPFLAYVPVGLFFRPPTRYLLPLLWSLAALEAVALVSLFRRHAVAVGLLVATPSAVLAGTVLLSTFRPFDLLLGRQDRETFLATRVPGYAATRFVNALPAGGCVMALDFPAPFYFDRPWIVEGILNEPPIRAELARDRSGEEVLAWLRSQDVRLLVVTPAYGGGRPVSLLPLARSPRELAVVLELKARLQLLGSPGGVDVYRVPDR